MTTTVKNAAVIEDSLVRFLELISTADPQVLLQVQEGLSALRGLDEDEARLVAAARMLIRAALVSAGVAVAFVTEAMLAHPFV